MEVNKKQTFSYGLEEKLSKIISSPLMYPDFPTMPTGIFSRNGRLQKNYSLYKKGTAYYVLDDGKGECREGMEVLDASKIVFSFTQQELESRHIGIIIREKVDKIVESPEIEIFEQAIETVISKKLFDTFSEYFGRILGNKLYELAHLMGDTDFSYLARISLVLYDDIYIVLDADIHFSRQELEHIKRAVFL